MLGADHFGKAQGAALRPTRQENPVEALVPKFPDRDEAIPEDADPAFAGLKMLCLGIGEEGVDIGISR